ncbi:MAG TPA: peptide-methionine (R)-S-oxide reductase MsrB [Candidatus Nanoarchaeia archaeon]|nr:peptide-methionine (R)-S-oxide reductase MsrB [Candidatus Nanoarchaeia archaeon]
MNTKKKLPTTEKEWKEVLNAQQYHVLREKGTELPFTGKYDAVYKDGKYMCAACGNVLFDSDTKYDAGCGWPSFWDVAKKDAIKLHEDKGFGMKRVEVTCAKCGGHLGHVFNDGPRDKTGLRYCINSTSLQFEEKKKKQK